MRNFRSLSKASALLAATASIALTSGLTACEKTVGPTCVLVKDSVRHYYPIIQKDELSLSFEMTNKGEETLVITDILPSCSAITLDQNMPEIIPPGKTEKLKFKFHSDMNIGFVSHDIRIYGNILPKGVCQLTFDVHVVRPTLDSSDYEEIFFEKQSAIKDLVDGKKGEKGYWVGDGSNPEDYSRHYNSPL